MLEGVRAGLVSLDKATGCVLEVNAAFLRMAKRERNEVAGRNFWEPPLIADAHAGAEVHRHLQTGGAVEDVELTLETGDGRRLLLEVCGTPIGNIMQLEVQDVTAREQMRRAERLETLRLLAVRTTGEFQNLHRTLQVMGELLLVNANRDRPVVRALEEVQQASERACSIACQLLAFSGEVGFQPQRVALNDLLYEMLPQLRQLFGRDIEIVCDLSADLEPVIADPAQIQQIVLKLATNSMEAMGPAGTFCVKTRNARAVEVGLGSDETGDGPYAMLVISDNGPGVDDQSWAHLFEPFSSTKPNGLGLGLAAVHGIVRQSGGRLWAYSQPGEGATFRIYLPLARTHFPALPAVPDPEIRCFESGATILLVESHDGMRATTANLLKKSGYRVLAAIDRQEASRIMEAQGPPQLLISQPAPELVRHLMRVQPHLRVLYLAGQFSELDGQTHGLSPWLSVLRKPFEPEALAAAVGKLLEQPL
jgi:two-component system, cell cycle sensor histidine kinase and response regulator CckA